MDLETELISRVTVGEGVVNVLLIGFTAPLDLRVDLHLQVTSYKFTKFSLSCYRA